MLSYRFPEIHLWCHTCQPLGRQHGSQAVSSTYLRDIGGTRSQASTVLITKSGRLNLLHLQMKS